MDGWIAEVRDAFSTEFDSQPWIATLATVDRDNRPRARNVVVRRMGDDGSIVIATDARSGKACQARHHQDVELVFWLPNRRAQIRIRGLARVISATDNDARLLDVWRTLSDATRASFFWPPPGRPFDADASFTTSVGPEVEPPLEFELLVIEPDHIDWLDISEFPHRRGQWVANGEWQFERINP